MFKALNTYKQLNRLLQAESFEPLLLWGLRMAVAAMLPLVWGLATHHLNESIWITLTAECLCWIELKGSFVWRFRILIAGSVAVFFFAFLGTITGPYFLFSLLAMLLVGFLSGILKNMGDRANGLAICVYLLFIFCNYFPVHDDAGLKLRLMLILCGIAWTVLVSMLLSWFMPAQQPYRRAIALIWKAIAELTESVSQGWDGQNKKSGIREVYLKEKEVRAAMNNSYEFYAGMAHQVSEKDKEQYQLAQVRKASGLVAAYIITLYEEIDAMGADKFNTSLRVKMISLFSALQSLSERMSVFLLSLRAEEETLLKTQISRVKKLLGYIKEDPENLSYNKQIHRIAHLVERILKLSENALGRLEVLGNDAPVYKSYPLVKTLFILHPKFWLRNLRGLLHFNTLTARYALRSALAATLAMFIYKWFNIDHGYWLPFSVMIVIQPYFGATLKKARDRVIGTVIGALVGGVFLRFPAYMHIKEALLFVTFIFMVYFIRRNYAIAVFIMTLNLVLLFNIDASLSNTIIFYRALATIGGSLLAVSAGFVLLPTWDKKWLPVHLAKAVLANQNYLHQTFYHQSSSINWTRFKRNAESANADLYDSFSRYIEDPLRATQKDIYFEIISHNIRITRYLNGIHLENEQAARTLAAKKDVNALNKINRCLELIRDSLQLLTGNRNKEIEESKALITEADFTTSQIIYIEKLFIELQSLHNDLIQLKL
jgi:uncharacterized membrane protein YccC